MERTGLLVFLWIFPRRERSKSIFIRSVSCAATFRTISLAAASTWSLMRCFKLKIVPKRAWLGSSFSNTSRSVRSSFS